MKPWLKLVAAGYFFHWAIQSLTQDMFGKARWLALAESGWVSSWITVPLALLVVAVVVDVVRKNKGNTFNFDVHPSVHIHVPDGIDKDLLAQLVADIETGCAINKRAK